MLDDLPHGVERVGAAIGAGQGGLEGTLISNLGCRRTVGGGPALEGIARAGEAARGRTGGGAIGGCIRRRGGVGDGHGRAGATAIVIGNGEGNGLLINKFANINVMPVARVIGRMRSPKVIQGVKRIKNRHARCPGSITTLFPITRFRCNPHNAGVARIALFRK